MQIEIAPKETEIRANWDDARMYCFSLNIDGKTGWRLPTTEELDYIHRVLNDLSTDKHQSTVFEHWSSAELADNTYAESYTRLYGGYPSTSRKDSINLVRVVRDLP